MRPCRKLDRSDLENQPETGMDTGTSQPPVVDSSKPIMELTAGEFIMFFNNQVFGVQAKEKLVEEISGKVAPIVTEDVSGAFVPEVTNKVIEHYDPRTTHSHIWLIKLTI